ncbi:thioredoxin family protein [Mucilaginibacter sp.]|uniref:thioredoxin family protein n=1 Tax=Mucilaginibacter sp. TaxID=1882438 RepID=UPI0025DEC3FA|nr:thioredoxin family protein [Mucilaginibacter sp.]
MSKQFTYMRTMFLTAATIFFAAIFVATAQVHKGSAKKMEPSLGGATGWLNTQPLTLANLRGKVVLIDFWTYTCINWRRTLPYIREWASKYKDQGLVVIGVHTPEFPFEKRLENISRSIKEMNIAYPVAVDSNFEIWNSFQNEYWPALYLIDAKGRIRYQKFGEGDYHESELQIQHLLKEVSGKTVSNKIVALQPQRFEAAADWRNLESAENYVGYNRTHGFASPVELDTDKQVLYFAPKQLKLNQWGLSGEWSMKKESLFLHKARGKIIYSFHARDLHLIMGPAMPGTAIKFRVLIDGNPPGSAHGLDVDSSGNGTVTEQRMYQLIRQQGPIIDREFQIEFLDPEVEVYDFTFG